MSMRTSGTNSANLHVYYSKTWLDVLHPRLVLYQFAEKTKLPKGTGKQVKWLRYSRISSNTNELSEGVIPQSSSVTSQNVTATIKQYGDYTKVSDLLEQTAIDPVVKNIMELFGEAAAETIEDLIVAELDASGATQRVNDRASNGAIVASDVLIMKELIEAKLTLKVDKVPAHKIGSYAAVLNPSCEYDLMVETNLGSWLDISQHGLSAKEQLLQGELGKAFGLRFFSSDKMTSSADGSGGISVYNNYVMGQRPFGCVELDGKNFEMIMKDRKSGGVSNPLEQFSTVGYKIPGFVAKYLGGASNGTADRLLKVKAASAL